MLGLFRTCFRMPAVPAMRITAGTTNVATRGQRMPFVPTDIMFRFFPNFTRDKVWYLYFHVVATSVGIGSVALFCHQPFEGEHASEGMFYNRRIRQLRDSGELAENLRLKATSFYPVEVEAEDED